MREDQTPRLGGGTSSVRQASELRARPYAADDTRKSTMLAMRQTFENWVPALTLRFLARRLDRFLAPLAGAAYDRQLDLRVRSGPGLRLRVRDLEGPMRVFGLGEYDFKVIDWTRVDTVIDAGAHVGSFSLWAALRAPCRIYALEPNPDVFKLLLANIGRAGVTSRVVTSAVALAGSSRTAVLHQPRGASDGASIVYDAGPGQVDVKAVTLGEVVAESGFESIDLLKLDIEGAEYEVFKTVPADLLQKIAVILIECHQAPDASPQQIIDKLGQAGFQVASDLDASGLLLAWRAA